MMILLDVISFNFSHISMAQRAHYSQTAYVRLSVYHTIVLVYHTILRTYKQSNTVRNWRRLVINLFKLEIILGTIC